jgi:CBS domain-containing protein
MRVLDVMTLRPSCVTRHTTLSKVAELMEAEDVGAIPVVDGDFVLGLVTDRDIVVRAVARGRDPHSTRVAEIASNDLVTVGPDHDLSEALILMGRHQLRRLPVTDEDNRLLGIVSQADVALEGKQKDVGKVVEAVSRASMGPRTVGPRDEPEASTLDAGETTEEDRSRLP